MNIFLSCRTFRAPGSSFERAVGGVARVRSAQLLVDRRWAASSRGQRSVTQSRDQKMGSSFTANTLEPPRCPGAHTAASGRRRQSSPQGKESREVAGQGRAEQGSAVQHSKCIDSRTAPPGTVRRWTWREPPDPGWRLHSAHMSPNCPRADASSACAGTHDAASGPQTCPSPNGKAAKHQLLAVRAGPAKAEGPELSKTCAGRASRLSRRPLRCCGMCLDLHRDLDL